MPRAFQFRSNRRLMRILRLRRLSLLRNSTSWSPSRLWRGSASLGRRTMQGEFVARPNITITISSLALSANTGIEYLTGRYPNAWSFVAPVISDSVGLFSSINSHLEQWRSSTMNSYGTTLAIGHEQCHLMFIVSISRDLPLPRGRFAAYEG